MKLDKSFYKRIKKMNREEMRYMLDAQFKVGFDTGVESGDNADFRIKLSQVLNKTKGIGPKLYDAVTEVAKEETNGKLTQNE